MSADPVETTAVVPTTAAIAPVQSHGSALVAPAAELNKIADAFAAYQRLKDKLLTPDDYQAISGKSFPKKSAWRKMGVAFGCSTEILRTSHERNERGRIIRTEMVVRATAPNGRYNDGYGACDVFERCCEGEGICTMPTHWADSGNVRHVHCAPDCPGSIHFSHAQHDIPATAETRAKNRALSDLFGFGEVSAEEVTDADGHESPRSANAPAGRAAPKAKRTDLDVPFDDKDRVKALGARWDKAAKVWYVEVADLSPFAEWLPEEPQGLPEDDEPPEHLGPVEEPEWQALGYANAEHLLDAVDDICQLWRHVPDDETRQVFKEWLATRGYAARWPVRFVDLDEYVEGLRRAANPPGHRDGDPDEAPQRTPEGATGRANDPPSGAPSAPKGPRDSKRLYLDVPFEDKGAAKKAGAKWDAKAKSWYAPSDATDVQGLMRWLPPDDEDRALGTEPLPAESWPPESEPF